MKKRIAFAVPITESKDVLSKNLAATLTVTFPEPLTQKKTYYDIYWLINHVCVNLYSLPALSRDIMLRTNMLSRHSCDIFPSQLYFSHAEYCDAIQFLVAWPLCIFFIYLCQRYFPNSWKDLYRIREGWYWLLMPFACYWAITGHTINKLCSSIFQQINQWIFYRSNQVVKY